MKNVILNILALIGLSAWGCTCAVVKPKDIRTDFLKQELTEKDYEKGKAMILEMEAAYGGREQWLGYEKATFVQRADWYGRKAISGWDTIPQRFELTTTLGNEDCVLRLLNGKNKGEIWGIENGTYYEKEVGKDRSEKENNRNKEKMIYKDYWFQFPFRIGEAAIIAYAGQEKVHEKTYDLVYATWGQEEANKEYDQFLLYLDPDTRFIEYLHFTVRDKLQILNLTARFDNFQQIESLTFPFSQYVTEGSPQKQGLKMHENQYESVLLDEEG